MASIFVSYARSDQPAASTLTDDLRALGHDPWFDQALSGGQEWWNQILGAIRRADVFCMVISQASLDSVACKRELAYALTLKRPVLPVLAQDVAIPLLPAALAERQMVDYRRGDRDGLRSLAKALTSLSPAGPLPDPLPQEPPIPVSYLSSLRDQVETTGILSFEDQSAIVLRLKGGLEGTERDHAEALLAKLRGRRDLYAQVGDEIDGLIRRRQPATPPSPSVAPQAPTKSTTTAKPQAAPSPAAPTPASGSVPPPLPLPSPIPAIVGSLIGAVLVAVAAVIVTGKEDAAFLVTPLVAVAGLCGSVYWTRSWNVGTASRVAALALPVVIGLVVGYLEDSLQTVVALGEFVTVVAIASVALAVARMSTGRLALVASIAGSAVGVGVILVDRMDGPAVASVLAAMVWIGLAAWMIRRWRASATR